MFSGQLPYRERLPLRVRTWRSPTPDPQKWEGYVAVYSIYLDESGKLASSADYTSFCGFVAHVTEWERLALEWNNCRITWQAPPIHMARIMFPDRKDDAWKGFKDKHGKNWDAARDAMLGDFAAIVRQSHLACVGAVVDANAFRALKDSDFKRTARDPLYFSFHTAIMRGIEKTEVVDKHSPVSVVVDDDAQFAVFCYNTLNQLKQNPDSRFDKVRERVHEISFGNDASYPGLQAADMVAYESRKLIVDRMASGNKPKPSDLFRMLTKSGLHQPRLYTAEILKQLESGTLKMLEEQADGASAD